MSKSFLYANGVVASLSNTLVSKDSLNRMIDAPTNLDAFNILQETNFASGISISTPFQIEELLSFETRKLLNFIKNESPNEELISLFLLPYDYNNISSYCKSLVLNQHFGGIEGEGFYEMQKIKDIISSKSYELLNNPYLENALKEFQTLSQKPSVRGDEIDFIFKKHLYNNLLNATSKNAIINKIVKLKIDIENLSVSMRASTVFQLEQQLLPVQEISEETLLNIFKKNATSLNTGNEILNKFIKLATSDNKEKSFVEFEKLKNTFMFQLLENVKDNIETIGPFAWFCFKKAMEIKNIRLIISYQNNNLNDKIKKRILEI